MAARDLSTYSRDGVTPPANAILVTDDHGDQATLEGVVAVVLNGFPGIGVKVAGVVRSAITFHEDSIVLSVLDAEGVVIADQYITTVGGPSWHVSSGATDRLYLDLASDSVAALESAGGYHADSGALYPGPVGSQAGYVDPVSETFAADLITALQATGLMAPTPGP